MRKPGKKRQLQKEKSVDRKRTLTWVSSNMLARSSNPSNKEKSVFLPIVAVVAVI
jgi:hypothetical protein